MQNEIGKGSVERLCAELADAAKVDSDSAGRMLDALGIENLVQIVNATNNVVGSDRAVSEFSLKSIRLGLRGHAINYMDLVA